MAKQTISGISGVLGELITPPTPPTESKSKKQLSVASPEPKSSNVTPTPTPEPCRARLGRPPGNNSPREQSKEKVTLRISSDLIAEYRDWSWEARCQLSELIERALTAYQKSERHS